MAFELMTMASSVLIQQHAVSEILKMNDLTRRFGLELTHLQAIELVETRFMALKDTGRIEFGGGITERLIDAFCDSQYLNASNYMENLSELLEIFYYLKDETPRTYMTDGLISDEDIIAGMKKAFETICQGSIALLAEREGLKIVRASFPDGSPDFNKEYEPDFNEDHNHEGGYIDDRADDWEQ